MPMHPAPQVQARFGVLRHPQTRHRLRLSRAAADRGLEHPHRWNFGGHQRGCACGGVCRGIAVLHEIAYHTTHTTMANHLAADTRYLVVDPHAFGGDHRVGSLLFVERLPAQCRGGVLLCRCHLHHDWLRRCGAGQTVAYPGTGRGTDRHPPLWTFGRSLLRVGHANFFVTVVLPA